MKNTTNKNHSRRLALHRKFTLKHRHKIGGKKKTIRLRRKRRKKREKQRS